MIGQSLVRYDLLKEPLYLFEVVAFIVSSSSVGLPRSDASSGCHSFYHLMFIIILN
jgi:hypothetical protein